MHAAKCLQTRQTRWVPVPPTARLPAISLVSTSSSSRTSLPTYATVKARAASLRHSTKPRPATAAAFSSAGTSSQTTSTTGRTSSFPSKSGQPEVKDFECRDAQG
eukprot:GHVT01068557.1.p1 GENE.GHVT01068557.1~~GHVT01068557.1.p1  ORF type:complete len:105 (+),score=13.91 GHVT01068557.1:598-912(+)